MAGFCLSQVRISRCVQPCGSDAYPGLGVGGEIVAVGLCWCSWGDSNGGGMARIYLGGTTEKTCAMATPVIRQSTVHAAPYTTTCMR